MTIPVRISSAAAAASLAALAAVATGCKPDLGAPISFIAATRIVAVRGTPPEAKEGGVVTFDMLAVDGDGTVAAPDAFWAVCQQPRPPSETNGVAAACLTIDDQAGPAPTFDGAVTAADPNDFNSNGACAIFGPSRPKSDPTARPRDPDITGGFYQPVRARLELAAGAGAELVAFDLERIQCNLANAPIDIANQFNNSYQANQNPTIGGLAITDAAGTRTDVVLAAPGSSPAPSASVGVGQRITLDASWAAGVAETFPVYDLQTVSLTQQREALRVSWFTTDGAFDHDATGRAGDDPELTVTNAWTAPAEAKVVHLWLVLRDNRGGVDFTELALDVVP